MNTLDENHLSSLSNMDISSGKVLSQVFYWNSEIENLLKDANTMFFWANGLSPMSFPSLKKFEAEVIGWLIHLLHGNENTVGNMTTGGTENILMTVKAAREYAIKEKGISHPEIIIPESAHPAFFKAAHYFNIKIHTIALQGKSFQPDPEDYEKAINENSILLAASAPCYVYGMVHPVKQIAEIALKHNLLFHVDANVGAFILPFLRNYSISEFDFKIEGVTSISADLYYAVGPKGAGVLLYNDSALRKYQFFTYANWAGGLYGSPTLTGSRAGGPIAASRALIKHLGKEGFQKMGSLINTLSETFISFINQSNHWNLLAPTSSNIITFTSNHINIKQAYHTLLKNGWRLDYLNQNNALRIHLAPLHENSLNNFIKELEHIHA